MTCIVAYKYNGKIYMGGDTLASNCSTKYRVSEPKVMKKIVRKSVTEHDVHLETKEMLIGYTTSFRMGQLLRHKFKLPKFKTNQDALEYLISEFVPAVIDLYDKNFYAKKSDAEKMNGGQFLIAFDGRVFEIQDDFSILERDEYDFNSCGSGAAYALGAMHILSGIDDNDPENAVIDAICSASLFSTSVNDHVVVESIDC
jgi:ATP-dependent protease HslVU (ClpYQ) peptidase subunit